MIDGDAAHDIEVLNYSNQVNVIEALVHLLMHHHMGEDGACISPPSERVLREFHRTATLFLLKNPGEFRDCPVQVSTSDGTVVHQPPPHEEVQQHTIDFFAELEKRWPAQTPQELGAYALWMINWIHPFKNGNGRTARAFCYACVSLKFGFVLSGTPTLIDLIMQERPDYQSALKVADRAFEAGLEPDLAPMIELVDRLLAQQFASIPHAP